MSQKVRRERLVNACDMLVRCWDRSTSADDFAKQAGAHIEDMRDIVFRERRVEAETYQATNRPARFKTATALPVVSTLGDRSTSTQKRIS